MAHPRSTTISRSASRLRVPALGGLALLLASAGCSSGNDAVRPGALPTSTATAAAATTARATASALPGSTASPYAPVVVPVDFSATVDNPYFPLVPGTRLTYEGKTADGLERIVVEVTRRTRVVMGVRTVVVRDTVTVDGEVVEDTFDWYAQHRDGSVWYFGEDTKELEDGKVVNTNGAWEAGVDGALPGVVMQADPQPGQVYRQEFYAGTAEDAAEVLRVGGSAQVRAGSYTDVLTTKDYTPLEADLLEHKSYAPGVGLVLEVDVKNGNERIELVRVEKP